MAKQHLKNKGGDSSNKESPKVGETPLPKITVSEKPNIEPAKETPPNQEVLKKPAPKQGMSLMASWNSTLRAKAK